MLSQIKQADLWTPGRGMGCPWLDSGNGHLSAGPGPPGPGGSERRWPGPLPPAPHGHPKSGALEVTSHLHVHKNQLEACSPPSASSGRVSCRGRHLPSATPISKDTPTSSSSVCLFFFNQLPAANVFVSALLVSQGAKSFAFLSHIISPFQFHSPCF